MANTRIKVGRDVLLARLNAERDRLGAAHTRALADHEAKTAAFLTKLQDEVDEFHGLLTKDPRGALKRITNGYGKSGCHVSFKGKVPVEPTLQTSSLDRLISVLEVAEDETISIATDDQYARYL